MLARVAVCCLLVTLALGCSRRAALFGGAATTLGGVLLVADASNDNCPDGGTACEITDEAFVKPIDAGIKVFGIGLIIAGVVLMAVGLGTDEPDREAIAPPPSAPPPIVATTSPSGPPGLVDAAALPADFAIRSRMENQLAIQVSVAARRGHCVAALASGRRLAEIDPELHRKLVIADAAYARCVVAQRM